MKRLPALLALVAALALPAAAAAFHHPSLPATSCASPAAGSPSNDNGRAKEAIVAHNPAQQPPLPPVGTEGEDNAATAPAHENCANA